jgi:hypothetical protein
MQTHNLPRSVARVLALAEVQHNPGEPFDEFTFDGRDIGLPDDEYVVVKYFRRKRKDVPIQTIPAFIALTPPMVYE